MGRPYIVSIRYPYKSAFSLTNFNFEVDPLRQDAFRSVFDANSTDLSTFRSRGGKFISVHGTSDPALTPYMSIEYFDKLNARMGNSSDFFRLYLDPNMAHCDSGTNAADTFGLLTPLLNWVEAGIPPDTIKAAKLDSSGAVQFTRKLCPYPQQEKYVGGDPNLASSFTCEVPPPLIAELEYGSTPHYFLSANVTEAYDVVSGKVGTPWQKTGSVWNAWQVGTAGTQPVYRFYFPSTVEGGTHFYTLNADEANGLRNSGSLWIYEGPQFAAKPVGACGPNDIVLTRYYKGDASTHNLPRHRYVATAAAGAQLLSQGWHREGEVMCLAKFPG